MFVFRQAAGVIVLLLSRMQGLHFPPAASRIILHANIYYTLLLNHSQSHSNLANQ